LQGKRGSWGSASYGAACHCSAASKPRGSFLLPVATAVRFPTTGGATWLATPFHLASVSRLMRAGECIGSAVRVSLTKDGEGDLVLTARHCVAEGGACLSDLVAFDSPLTYLASRADLDVAVLRGCRGRGLWLMQQPLQQGAQLGLLSYPLPIDVELAAAAGLSGGAAGSASAMGTGPTVDVGIVAQVGPKGLAHLSLRRRVRPRMAHLTCPSWK
jgi:hypothetical protein